MNSNLNSDLACAVNFEFESKDLRCAKAALRYPSSGVLSGRLLTERSVSRNCYRGTRAVTQVSVLLGK